MRSRTFAVTALLLAVAVVPAAAETSFQETKKLDPGGRFVLDADTGSVTVTGALVPGARITVRSKSDSIRDVYDFRFEESPGLVRVTIKRKGPRAILFGRDVHLDVQVPQRTALELHTAGGAIGVADIEADATLETSGGAIRVTKLTGNVHAETSGGGIEVDTIRGSLEAGSSGGSIRIREVSGDIQAETSGGGIRIEGAGGRVSAKTSGGGIEAHFGPGNSKGGDLETSGGGVKVFLDSTADVTLDAESSGGSVTSSIPVAGLAGGDRSSLRGTVGRGGATLRLRSSGGPVRIERNGAER